MCWCGRRGNIVLVLVDRESISSSTNLSCIAGASFVAVALGSPQCGVQSVATIAFSTILSPEVIVVGAVGGTGREGHRIICILGGIQSASGSVGKISITSDVFEVSNGFWFGRVEGPSWRCNS